jgi:predicted transcriptional regulator
LQVVKKSHFFVNSPSDVPGRQRTVAKLLGIAQSNVSRYTNLPISPFKGQKKRKARCDTIEQRHPAAVPVVINHWVSFLI